jgi:hypothetical protein
LNETDDRILALMATNVNLASSLLRYKREHDARVRVNYALKQVGWDVVHQGDAPPPHVAREADALLRKWDNWAKGLEGETAEERSNMLCGHLFRALQALFLLRQVEDHANHYSGECVNRSLQARRYLDEASSAARAIDASCKLRNNKAEEVVQ